MARGGRSAEQGRLETGDELLRREKGLADEVGRAGTDALDSDVDIAFRGYHDYGRVGADTDLAEALCAVDPRQDQVQEDEINRLAREQLKRFFQGFGCIHPHPVPREQTPKRSQDGRAVIDDEEVIELDRDHDRLWGALSGACGSLAAGLGSGNEQGAAAGRLETAVFSSGVPALIHLPFVEQRETTDAWLARLRGELAADVEKAGVLAIVQRLTDVNTRFGALLDKRNEESNLSYADVREADSEGQIKFYQIIAMLMGREAENDAERARLLAPILAQNEEIGELYRRRRAVPDVDPTTGEVTEPSPGVT